MNKLKTVQLGSRGQFVIPQEFRKDLELKEGETLVVFENGNELVIKKQKAVIESLNDPEMKVWLRASIKTLNKIWENEPEGLWESYL
ncbi:MAG: AbrB/MazE/SpoVT family DNA-binding domain-containing protein [Candidatus Diapherotrites archaeon]